MDARLFPLKRINDSRGSLVTLDKSSGLPFDVHRCYYLFNVQHSEPRGFHAHKNLEQILICLQGSCEVILDDGKTKEVYSISSPDTGLYVGKKMWREMHHFTNDCILLVLASEPYNEDDYIRSYEDFLTFLKGN